MSRKCTICAHPQREAIDKALLGGDSYRNCSAMFRLSSTALYRHKLEHIPEKLALAKEAEQIDADSLLDQVQDLQKRALTILRKAELSGDLRTSLSAIREARSNLELLARLLGELREGPTVNILLSPQWVTLRSTILVALTPFPEARLALAEALKGVDDAGN